MTIEQRKPGDKKIPARDWNALASAYNSGMIGGSIRGESVSNSPVVVLVKNNTGGDLGRRAVVGLGDSVISLADNEVQWKNEIVLNGEIPEAGTHDTKYAILQTSLVDGAIGEAVICGAVQVLLNVVASGDTHASIADGETDYLTTSGSGTAEIIWKESGTGEKLGIVRLCSQASVTTALFTLGIEASGMSAGTGMYEVASTIVNNITGLSVFAGSPSTDGTLTITTPGKYLFILNETLNLAYYGTFPASATYYDSHYAGIGTTELELTGSVTASYFMRNESYIGKNISSEVLHCSSAKMVNINAANNLSVDVRFYYEHTIIPSPVPGGTILCECIPTGGTLEVIRIK